MGLKGGTQLLQPNGSLPQDPKLWRCAVYKGGWDAAGRFASVDNHRNSPTQLLKHLLRADRALRPREIGGCDCHGSRGSEQGASDLMVWHAHAHSGGSRNGFGQIRALRDKDR